MPGIIPYSETPGADPWQGAYEVRCSLLDKDGKVLAAVTNEVPLNKEPWTGFMFQGKGYLAPFDFERAGNPRLLGIAPNGSGPHDGSTSSR